MLDCWPSSEAVSLAGVLLFLVSCGSLCDMQGDARVLWKGFSDLWVTQLFPVVRYTNDLFLCPFQNQNNVLLVFAGYLNHINLINVATNGSRRANASCHDVQTLCSEAATKVDLVLRSCGELVPRGKGEKAACWWKSVRLFWWETAKSITTLYYHIYSSEIWWKADQTLTTARR